MSGGITTVQLTGNHYLTDEASGRVWVEYYDADHNLLGTDDSGLHEAPGNAKTQWFVNETFSSSTVEHVHVELLDENWVLIDMLDIYRQLGVDVLARLAEFNKARNLGRIHLSDGMEMVEKRS